MNFLSVFFFLCENIEKCFIYTLKFKINFFYKSKIKYKTTHKNDKFDKLIMYEKINIT